MEYQEVKRDLFTVPEDYCLAHCISADFAMGKGIAVQFNQHFDMRNKLRAAYPGYLADWQAQGLSFDCILQGRVFNLITKERYYHKPTYQSLQGALEIMRGLCQEQKIRRLAMPLIGCGLDGLQWQQVSGIIQQVFAELDGQILVCIK